MGNSNLESLGMTVHDVVSYISCLKKEKEDLMRQVKDIDLELQKIRESINVTNKEVTREL